MSCLDGEVKSESVNLLLPPCKKGIWKKSKKTEELFVRFASAFQRYFVFAFTFVAPHKDFAVTLYGEELTALAPLLVAVRLHTPRRWFSQLSKLVRLTSLYAIVFACVSQARAAKLFT